MTRPVLLLRPEPGASESARLAETMGLRAVVAPLFRLAPIAWEAPDPRDFDAVMLTSANAARLAGAPLAPFLQLRCHAVGEATAAAAQAAGFRDVRIGPSDGAALVETIAATGAKSLFHPCGRDRRLHDHPRLRIVSIPVYAAEAETILPVAAAAALAAGAPVLAHSPRAAAAFARLCPVPRSQVTLVAISSEAMRAAGPGWGAVHVAERPRDAALLELAAKLCQTEG